MISRSEVKKLAELSLLAVEEEEIDTLRNEIDAILEYVKAVDTIASQKGSEKETLDLYNVYREDVVTNDPHEYTERLVQEMPKTEGTYLTVKKIL